MKTTKKFIDSLKEAFKKYSIEVCDEYTSDEIDYYTYEFVHNGVTFQIDVSYTSNPNRYNIVVRPTAIYFMGYIITDNNVFYEEDNDLSYNDFDEDKFEDSIKGEIIDLILNCSLYDEIKKATEICNKINVADSDYNYSCTIPNLVGRFIYY